MPRVQKLTAGSFGVGTRFRATAPGFGRAELEISEYAEPTRVLIRVDSPVTDGDSHVSPAPRGRRHAGGAGRRDEAEGASRDLACTGVAGLDPARRHRAAEGIPRPATPSGRTDHGLPQREGTGHRLQTTATSGYRPRSRPSQAPPKPRGLHRRRRAILVPMRMINRGGTASGSRSITRRSPRVPGRSNGILDALDAAGGSVDDFTPAQARVFQRIAPDGSRLTDLAEQAGITKQSAGFLVDQLDAPVAWSACPTPRTAGRGSCGSRSEERAAWRLRPGSWPRWRPNGPVISARAGWHSSAAFAPTCARSPTRWRDLQRCRRASSAAPSLRSALPVRHQNACAKAASGPAESTGPRGRDEDKGDQWWWVTRLGRCRHLTSSVRTRARPPRPPAAASSMSESPPLAG